MPHINSLPLNVLAQILFKAALPPANRLYRWKEKLPLLAVCQAWKKLAETFVLSQVIVEVSEVCSYKGKPIVKLAPDTHSTRMVWRSNAKLILSRNCMLNVKQMTMKIPRVLTYSHLQRIVLGVLCLDHVSWPHINTLSFVYPPLFCGHNMEPDAIDEQMLADIERTMRYFGQNMRRIVELNLTREKNENIEDLVYANLASIYCGQLQVLRAAAPVVLNFSYFRNIAVLDLSLDSTEAPVIPSVCGETLKVLRLYNVPRNFAWHYFRYDFYARPIMFRRLTILHLSYERKLATAAEIQSKAASGALNCDQLVFPALIRLTIENCTPDYDLPYAEAPFTELKRIHILGALDDISHCSRLKLAWVRDLHVEVNLTGANEAAKLNNVTNHFFSGICIGRTATLRVNFGRFTLDPELIRWINLTRLKVPSISHRTLCRVIARLPNLTHFSAHCLEFGGATIESLVVNESLFASADPLLVWGEKLAIFMVSTFDDDCSLKVGALGIQAFIWNAGALIELTVPVEVRSIVQGFINTFKDSHPRLAKITLNRPPPASSPLL